MILAKGESIMIQSYLWSMLAACVLTLAVYLPLRLLWLRLQNRKTQWQHEVMMALLVCYTVSVLSQTVLPELRLDRFGDGRLEGNVLFYSGNQLIVSARGFEWVHAAQPMAHRWNLIPFRTISSYLRPDGYAVNDSIRFVNLLGNVLVFVPFGALLPLAFARMRRWYRVFLCGSAFIAFIEITQFFIGRAADIDDYILNILGVMLGYWSALLCLRLARRRRPTLPSA